MKELIEIPNSNVIANTESCFGISFDGMDYQKIIMGGTPIPDNATNGDIYELVFGKKGSKNNTNEWWNKKYEYNGN